MHECEQPTAGTLLYHNQAERERGRGREKEREREGREREEREEGGRERERERGGRGKREREEREREREERKMMQRAELLFLLTILEFISKSTHAHSISTIIKTYTK